MPFKLVLADSPLGLFLIGIKGKKTLSYITYFVSEVLIS